MSNATHAAEAPPSGASASFNPVELLLKYGILIFVDVIAVLLIVLLTGDGVYELAGFLVIVTLLINYINLKPGLGPLRWIAPALTLMLLFIVYPMIYTIFVAFTNYGDGHILTLPQAIERITVLGPSYVPEDATTYGYELYRNEAGDYALWLTDAEDNNFFVTRTGEVEPAPAGEAPETYEGYSALPANERFRALGELETATFGTGDEQIGITRREAAAFEKRYTWNPENETFTDQMTGDVYSADYERGEFINFAAYETALAENPDASVSDYTLITGFRTLVGFDNFTRFLTSPAISGPLLRIFLWTIGFALLSVFTTFVLGLLIALLLNTDIPFKRFFRTLLIVPYAIPALIAVATWKGMLDPNLGALTILLEGIVGNNNAPPFFTDPFWAKVGILMVNLWLGYPYFMLVCSGALAAIPSDMYEAAKVDGANAWEQFRDLTLPMLLIAVGPLLIASFTFNFNNFVIIEVYNKGGPPIPGTPTPAGHTDILISYAFRLAFGSGRGADYGLASAITIIIFLMVAAVTLFQFRFTRQLEELSENV